MADDPPLSLQERVMTTAYLTVTLIAIAANGFSGIAAVLHFQPIMPGMVKAGVPISWLTFPIGTMKTLGALGLAAGLVFRPLGVSAAIGLVLFFVCAIYTHIRASDYSPQFGLAIGFLSLNAAALALSLPA
ncbi:MAG TPA: DoxX family protein [Mycobacterium sp.]|nr:DoxX family protein [Mycobacterium sp.]